MQALRVFSGNRLEVLAEGFAKILATPLASPFDQEIILVQSKGMERYLAMQIATHLGICSNCRFPFPNAFVDEIFRIVLPGLPGSPLFDPWFCAWRIMQILPGHLSAPGFAPLRHYLDGPGRGLKQLQLARRIAETFDQYLIYRPELIAAWESGSEDHWQAVLWRELCRGHERRHRAAQRDDLLQRLARAAPGEYPLPVRIAVFGISYLPAFHVQILQSLSRLTEVNLFLLNPCREYWGDIPSNREIRRIATKNGRQQRSPEELHLQGGNSLLASMGALGRDYFDLLTTLGCEEHELFSEGPETTLLERIQIDILRLANGAERSAKERILAEDDNSISIHSCHSAMREVEVLYDHLLAMFELDPRLLPGDIIVMTPDIESYAPFFEAVFGAPDDERKRIPYSVADRSLRQESSLIDAFLAVLDLYGERLTAPRVLAVLELQPVRQRLGLGDSALDVIVKWVREARIRWGIDERDRAQWNTAAFRENTWMAGIDRLLLGYALPGGGDKLFGEILPYDPIEGGETSVLGALLTFLTDLFKFLEALKASRTLSEWVDLLSGLISDFFVTDEEGKAEVHRLRQVLRELGRVSEVSGFEGAVEFELIRWVLGRELEREGFGRGFITGGVTFCSMLPMRSIPFKIVCLVGMNENAFPRQSRPLEFDLMAKAPRPGDRSVRNEDRYLFLEAILSARSRLYISYTGQNCRDNTAMPPSVLVSELSDYINKNYRLAEDERSDWFFTKHRLQTFNPAYFRGDLGFFSYSRHRLREAQLLLAEKHDPPLFVGKGLSAPDEALRTVNVADLCRFFANPANSFLNQRLGVRLGEEASLVEDAECFELDALERFAVEQELVRAALAGDAGTEPYQLLKASGQLPHGTPGEVTFQELQRQVQIFVAESRPHLEGERLEPLGIDLQVGDFNLTGTLSSIYPQGLRRLRYANLKAKDHLNTWIMHLVLNAVGESGYPSGSMVIGLKKRNWTATEYLPVAESREILERLLVRYWEGLHRPLHFFPETSLEYLTRVVEKATAPEEAIRKAEPIWFGNDHYRGESLEPHLQLCFRDSNPLDADFRSLAEEVYGPLLKFRREV